MEEVAAPFDHRKYPRDPFSSAVYTATVNDDEINSKEERQIYVIRSIQIQRPLVSS